MKAPIWGGCEPQYHHWSPWRLNSQTGKYRRTCIWCTLVEVKLPSGEIKKVYA